MVFWVALVAVGLVAASCGEDDTATDPDETAAEVTKITLLTLDSFAVPD